MKRRGGRRVLTDIRQLSGARSRVVPQLRHLPLHGFSFAHELRLPLSQPQNTLFELRVLLGSSRYGGSFTGHLPALVIQPAFKCFGSGNKRLAPLVRDSAWLRAVILVVLGIFQLQRAQFVADSDERRRRRGSFRHQERRYSDAVQALQLPQQRGFVAREVSQDCR
eukprot:scaffold7358_cov252-Pinguiococcus_pyrenoidosus.AAC.31